MPLHSARQNITPSVWINDIQFKDQKWIILNISRTMDVAVAMHCVIRKIKFDLDFVISRYSFEWDYFYKCFGRWVLYTFTAQLHLISAIISFRW